jgi:hypothetical protein
LLNRENEDTYSFQLKEIGNTFRSTENELNGTSKLFLKLSNESNNHSGRINIFDTILSGLWCHFLTPPTTPHYMQSSSTTQLANPLEWIIRHSNEEKEEKEKEEEEMLKMKWMRSKEV